MGIACKGIVRGEEPTHWSPTLQQCRNWGMELQFVNRSVYAELTHIHSHPYVEANSLVVPEGGFGIAGAKGAALIAQYIPAHTTHCITAMGTATTLAGLIIGLDAAIQKIGVPVLKGITDWPERLHLLCGATVTANYFIADGYHFGGYAKKNEQLIQWLNTCFAQWQVPLDWVYTAKMMYTLLDMAQHNFFATGSQIVALHTGGLQGNASLPAGTLTFG
jgi:1-aminocyclopropane-1-carboxylate deaminase/D-cysteine desulfhydrase-like pyridoxal-dependent ACC family enzyme